MRSLQILSWQSVLLVAIGVFSATSFTLGQTDPIYDVVIKQGRIVDGTGAPWYVADVGIREGKIAKIGRIEEELGSKVIDAKGLVVAPGFIDMMGQTATPMFDDPKTAMNLLTQGITTINAGEGASAAPLTKEAAERRGWQTMAEYFQLIDMQGLPVNMVQTVGHTQVRRIVMGEVDRRPSDEEMTEMKALVAEAMRAGAIGLSTALIYPPAVYARTEEIARLATVAGEHGGGYYTHMRNEGDQLLEAVEEALDIGRSGKTPVHIFHLKAAGRQNWGKMQLAIARIKEARSQGQQVTADVYPYINNGLGIAALIHPRHFAKGRQQLLSRLDDEELRAEIRREMETTDGWENWYRHVGKDWSKVVIGQANDPRYANLAGQSVASMAEQLKEDPWDTFFALVRSGAFALPQSMSEANKILAMQQEFVSICTDVGPAGGASSASHPRAFGAFPRFLSRYVRDLGVISLEQAVAQASAVAANDILAFDRGRISEGLAADVIVFDYNQLTDNATFASPHELSEGMKYVLVNGQLVLEDGKFTNKRPGRVLRGPGFRATEAAHAVSQGTDWPACNAVDQVIQQFMLEHSVPGLSLAIADGDRLLYAKGYGYADVGSHEQVNPHSRFRIASISKPVTAVAIMQLVDQGKLDLDARVLDVLSLGDEVKEVDEFDERQRDITIRHLLQHRGGWDRNKSFDAMFQSVRFAQSQGLDAPAGPDAVIRAMLDQKLDFEPGERYAYSNYGYCLLGRVIEKLTGQSYDQYVCGHVLEPIGVRGMVIGGTRLSKRQSNEVRYYHPGQGRSVFQDDLGRPVPHPYGAWYVEAMDSHGGWIASSVDLAKFACSLSDPDDCPLLTSESLKLMVDRPEGAAGYTKDGEPKKQFYGLGWSVAVGQDGNVTASHSGSLPGTNTRLIRTSDGRSIVILINARSSPTTGRLVNVVLDDLLQAIDEVDRWPENDQFPQYLGNDLESKQ